MSIRPPPPVKQADFKPFLIAGIGFIDRSAAAPLVKQGVLLACSHCGKMSRVAPARVTYVRYRPLQSFKKRLTPVEQLAEHLTVLRRIKALMTGLCDADATSPTQRLYYLRCLASLDKKLALAEMHSGMDAYVAAIRSGALNSDC